VLLSPIEEKGFGRFDRYDERSLIENQVNREGKQHFGLGQTLARNRSAFWSATVFSLLALMLYRALNEHREEMAEIAEMREEKLGVLRYRREQMIKNRGRIIVVVRDCYTIMHWTEFAELVGVGFL
jgi:hypothetical protein